jgi:ABC-type dipeptide/oligopeptide/nickel transport system permease component
LFVWFGLVVRALVVAFVLVIVMIFVFINLVTDLIYMWLDPRVRFGTGAFAE